MTPNNDDLASRLRELGTGQTGQASVRDVIARGDRIRRRRRIGGFIGGTAAALVVVAFIFSAFRTVSRNTSSSVSSGEPPINVIVVEHAPLKNNDVDLLPIPDGYSPGLTSSQALDATMAQLSAGVRPDSVDLYLGVLAVDGRDPVWVAVMHGLCLPVVGPSPAPGQAVASMDCASGHLAVAVNADNGSLVVVGN